MPPPAHAFPWYLAGVSSWFASSGMQTIVFPWLVTVVLHEPAARVGIAQMSLMAPSIFLMLLGGAVADRADCRRLLVRGHLVAALPPLLLGLAIAQGWHLAIAVFHQIVRLLVLAFAEIDVDIGKGMAAQGEHEPHRVGRAGGHGAMEGKTLLVATCGCHFDGFFGL